MSKNMKSRMVKMACLHAMAQTSRIKTSSNIKEEVSFEVIEVIARHMTANSRHDFTKRKAFFSLVKKVKKIIEIFKKAPQAWSKFKNLLGVTASKPFELVKELDKKLGDILQEGKTKLKAVAKKVWMKIPLLRLVYEVLEEENRWEKLVNKTVAKLPAKVKNIFSKIEKGAETLGDFLDKILSKSRVLEALATPVKIYLFFSIWDWYADFDLRAVIAGLLGTLSFTDLVAMLPGEAIEIILQLLLPPPISGAFAKLVIGVGVSSTYIVILILEVRYLMKLHNVSTTKELLVILEAN